MSPATNLRPETVVRRPETVVRKYQFARVPVLAILASTVHDLQASHVRALYNVLNGEAAMATIGHVAILFAKRDGLISRRHHLHCACLHLACDSRYRIICFGLSSLADLPEGSGEVPNKFISFHDICLMELCPAICATKVPCSAITKSQGRHSSLWRNCFCWGSTTNSVRPNIVRTRISQRDC